MTTFLCCSGDIVTTDLFHIFISQILIDSDKEITAAYLVRLQSIESASFEGECWYFNLAPVKSQAQGERLVRAIYRDIARQGDKNHMSVDVPLLKDLVKAEWGDS